MKLKLPLEIVAGRFPIVTQEFGDQSNVQWYKDHGVNINAHNGIDIVIGGGSKPGQDTYGVRLVCPVHTAMLNKVWQLDPMNTQGNGLECQWPDARGTIKMILWHTSETIRQAEYAEGQTMGYIGNSGLCNPAPSIWNVYAGSHLHLGCKLNDELIDPREVFDFSQWHISETDTSIEKDLPPFIYFIQKIKDAFTTMTQ